MAIDLEDPETKSELQKIIAAEVKGLKAKNDELLGKLNEARKGQQIDPEDHAKLERRTSELQDQLDALEKAATKAKAEAEKSSKLLESEREASKQLAVGNGLSAALAKANVAPHFSEAVKAMLASKVSVTDDRDVMVGDKSLNDFVTEWSQSDEGKHYIVAPVNSGGGANGSNGGGGAKTITRSEFDSKGAAERMAFVKDGGQVTD